jgi:gas vesicle protein
MRRSYVSAGIISFTVGAVIIALIVFAFLQALKMPAGSFLDWLIGIGTFAWLMTVVVVPWDVYFESSEVIAEAKLSEQAKIEFDKNQLPYVRRLQSVSLLVAIVLHLLSAAGLYWLAVSGVSVVGYFGAGAALLLTLLRPAIRTYEYISTRLAMIRSQIKYPRQDVNKLIAEVDYLLAFGKDLKFDLDTQEPDSWRNRIEKLLNDLHNWHNEIEKNLENYKADQRNNWDKMNRETRQMFEKIREDNEREYEKIADEHKQSLVKLSRDGKFVDNFVENLAEIVRFIKKA